MYDYYSLVFTIRISEYLDGGGRATGDKTRHPPTTDEIEPSRDGLRAEWSEGVNEISIYISGSKTDWLNQSMVRSHNLIPSSEPDARLCPVRGLTMFWEIRPPEFRRNTDAVFSSWKSGKPIKADRAVAMLSLAVLKQGFNHTAFSLHSHERRGRDGIIPGYRKY